MPITGQQTERSPVLIAGTMIFRHSCHPLPMKKCITELEIHISHNANMACQIYPDRRVMEAKISPKGIGKIKWKNSISIRQ